MDNADRDAFADQGGALLLHPSFAPPIGAYAAMENACLPWVVAGPALDAARKLLARRARTMSPARGLARHVSRGG